MRYRVLLSQGVERRIEADWHEERRGVVYFMRDTPEDFWTRSAAAVGGTQVEAIPAAEVLKVTRLAPNDAPFS